MTLQFFHCRDPGAGEYITRASLARSIAQALELSDEADTHEILQRMLTEYFIGSSHHSVVHLWLVA